MTTVTINYTAPVTTIADLIPDTFVLADAKSTNQICDTLIPTSSASDTSPFDGSYYDTNVEGKGEGTSVEDFFANSIPHPGLIAALKLARERGTYTFKTVDELVGLYIENVERALEDQGYTFEISYSSDSDIQLREMPDASKAYVGSVVQYVGPSDAMYTHNYFYECVAEGEPPVYSWQNVNVQNTSGSGGGTLTKSITAAISLGGVPAGKVYPVGTNLEDILRDLLQATLYPTITAPTLEMTYEINDFYGVGDIVPTANAILTFNRGSIDPAYGTSGYRSGPITNYTVKSVGADTEYSQSSTTSRTFAVSGLTRSTKGTIVLTGTTSYAAGEQPKDSAGNNYGSPLPAGSLSESKTLTFIQPYYFGTSPSMSVSDFTGFDRELTDKEDKVHKYTTDNEYPVFAYDVSYGELTSIKDENGFELISGWLHSVVTINGASYYVYTPDTPTTDTNAEFIFTY